METTNNTTSENKKYADGRELTKGWKFWDYVQAIAGLLFLFAAIEVTGLLYGFNIAIPLCVYDNYALLFTMTSMLGTLAALFIGAWLQKFNFIYWLIGTTMLYLNCTLACFIFGIACDWLTKEGYGGLAGFIRIVDVIFYLLSQLILALAIIV